MTNGSLTPRPFQQQTLSLTETICHKVNREAPKLHLTPSPPIFFFADLYVTLRQSREIVSLLCWIYTDESRQDGFDRTKGYALQALQLICALVDRLYNLLALLDDPCGNAVLFRKDGYWRMKIGLDEDEKLYSNEPDSG